MFRVWLASWAIIGKNQNLKICCAMSKHTTSKDTARLKWLYVIFNAHISGLKTWKRLVIYAKNKDLLQVCMSEGIKKTPCIVYGPQNTLLFTGPNNLFSILRTGHSLCSCLIGRSAYLKHAAVFTRAIINILEPSDVSGPNWFYLSFLSFF